MGIKFCQDDPRWAGVCFDPGTLTIASMAATAASGAISAGSTLAGGNYAAAAGGLQKEIAYTRAGQVEQSGMQAFASNQRQALETQRRTKAAIATSVARAAGSGVDPGTGSPAEHAGELAKQGSYHTLMQLWNGESERTSAFNQADAIRFGGDVAEIEGEQKRRAAAMAALGTLAGTAGSMFSTYGRYAYPGAYGRSGRELP